MMQRNISTMILAAILLQASCRYGCGGGRGAEAAAAAKTTKLKVENKCGYEVWPGIMTGGDENEEEEVGGGGMRLGEGESVEVEAGEGWSGRVWGRTGCEFEDGKGYCETGDCGGMLRCGRNIGGGGGGGGQPPVTLAEFTLGTRSRNNGDEEEEEEEEDKDFYDVSLVDGFNVAIAITAQVVAEGGGSADEEECLAAGCSSGKQNWVDLLGSDCPPELQQTDSSGSRVLACRSACDALGDPSLCCTGAFSTPDSCSPSPYSRLFKSACPSAYSYAYDDPTSTFTCSAPSRSYTITFCPP